MVETISALCALAVLGMLLFWCLKTSKNIELQRYDQRERLISAFQEIANNLKK